jgi:hypothetical protein
MEVISMLKLFYALLGLALLSSSPLLAQPPVPQAQEMADKDMENEVVKIQEDDC